MPSARKNTLSVLFPNYNQGALLNQLISALFEQNRPPDEIVIIDDASTDDSLTTLQKMAEQDCRIKLYTNERNRGVVYTLNRALEISSGDYVTFPSDNILKPTMYEKSMTLLEQYPDAGLCFSDPVIFYEDVQEIRFIHLKLSENPTYFSPEKLALLSRKRKFTIGNMCHTTIVKKEALKKAGKGKECFLSELKYHCDFFAINVVAFREGACYIPEPLATFRVVKNSYSSKIYPWKERRPVYRAILNTLNAPSHKDVKLLFQKSTILAEFSYSLLRAVLEKPAYYDYLTFAYTCRACHDSLRHLLRFVLIRIPYARPVYRKIKSIIKR